MSDFQTVPGSSQIFIDMLWGLSQEGCYDRERGGCLEQGGLIPQSLLQQE